MSISIRDILRPAIGYRARLPRYLRRARPEVEQGRSRSYHCDGTVSDVGHQVHVRRDRRKSAALRFSTTDLRNAGSSVPSVPPSTLSCMSGGMSIQLWIEFPPGVSEDDARAFIKEKITSRIDLSTSTRCSMVIPSLMMAIASGLSVRLR
jgi:hypothetical protein